MYDLSVRKREQTDMREWLRGGASPCQGEGRGFESRLALSFFARKSSNHAGFRGFLYFPKVLDLCRNAYPKDFRRRNRISRSSFVVIEFSLMILSRCASIRKLSISSIRLFARSVLARYLSQRCRSRCSVAEARPSSLRCSAQRAWISSSVPGPT